MVLNKSEIDIEKLDSWVKMVGRSIPNRDREREREREIDTISTTTMIDMMREVDKTPTGLRPTEDDETTSGWIGTTATMVMTDTMRENDMTTTTVNRGRRG